MVETVYSKTILKCSSKPRYMSHKIFDDNLVAIRKNKTCIKTLQTSIHWNMHIRFK